MTFESLTSWDGNGGEDPICYDSLYLYHTYIFNDYSFVYFTSSLTLDTLYRVCDSMHRFYDFIWQLD